MSFSLSLSQKMRRASALASSVLSRALPAAHYGGATYGILDHRFVQVSFYSADSQGGSYSRGQWFYGFRNSFSARAVGVGVAGAFVSVAVATSLSQDVYAKEPPPADALPKDVVLYQYEACPFCNKVKAFLDYYDIPYKVVEVNPITKKEIKWSDYKKVPILMVDGEQLVESSVIINQLSDKVLSKKKTIDAASDDVVDEEKKWRRWVDNHLVHVLSPNIYRNTSEALESFDYITSHGNFSYTEKLTVKYAGAVAMYFVSKGLKKKYNITDERAALYEAAETWVDALDGHEFLGKQLQNMLPSFT
uniref:Prostaglandin E synthase 2 n=1 Tax=Rhizophora mucronata TaxID=61149 RepID=A0A2P2KGZ0_RHIMU